MNITTFNFIVWLWTATALIVFVVLLYVTAPYGRHSKLTWGVTIPDRLGWFLMEVPAPVIFIILVIAGGAQKTIVVWIITALYMIHYINRALIYPMRIKTTGKVMPLSVAIMAVFFNFINAGFLGYYTGYLHDHFSNEWLTDPKFISGIIIFIAGMVINITSDEKLINLRKNKSNGYLIPHGGLFEKVSCPNFLGEIIEWGGYAMICWSLPAFSFFVWTFCNLVPRALSHHKWYKGYFPDYPKERKAIFPYIL